MDDDAKTRAEIAGPVTLTAGQFRALIAGVDALEEELRLASGGSMSRRAFVALAHLRGEFDRVRRAAGT